MSLSLLLFFFFNNMSPKNTTGHPVTHYLKNTVVSHIIYFVCNLNVSLGSTKKCCKNYCRYVNEVILCRCSNNPRNLGSLVTMNANHSLNIPAVPPAAGSQLRVSCLLNVLAHKRFPQPRPLIFRLRSVNLKLDGANLRDKSVSFF